MKNLAKGTQWEQLVDDFLSKLIDFENAVKKYKNYIGNDPKQLSVCIYVDFTEI